MCKVTVTSPSAHTTAGVLDGERRRQRSRKRRRRRIKWRRREEEDEQEEEEEYCLFVGWLLIIPGTHKLNLTDRCAQTLVYLPTAT